MPRKPLLTVADLMTLRDVLLICSIDASLRSRAIEWIDSEIKRRDRAGKLGGRPIKEVLKQIADEAAPPEERDLTIDYENYG